MQRLSISKLSSDNVVKIASDALDVTDGDTVNSGNYASIKAEYDELTHAMRHYSSLRFAILTVFFAVIGGLIAISFNPTPANQFVQMSTRFGGLLATVVFAIYEYRLEVYLLNFENRAIHIERVLGYKIYTERSKGSLPLLSTRLATRTLYGVVTTFWLLSFVI